MFKGIWGQLAALDFMSFHGAPERIISYAPLYLILTCGHYLEMAFDHQWPRVFPSGITNDKDGH